MLTHTLGNSITAMGRLRIFRPVFAKVAAAEYVRGRETDFNVTHCIALSAVVREHTRMLPRTMRAKYIVRNMKGLRSLFAIRPDLKPFFEPYKRFLHRLLHAETGSRLASRAARNASDG